MEPKEQRVYKHFDVAAEYVLRLVPFVFALTFRTPTAVSGNLELQLL
jgi:hypothetical protein